MSKQQTSGDRPNADTRKPSALAPVAVAMWALAAAGSVALLYFATPDSALILGGLEGELPMVTELALSAGAFLHQSTGLLIVVGAVLATLLPFVLGARGKTATTAYFAMTLFGLLIGAATWYCLSHPVDLLAQHLELPALPFGK